MQEYHSEPNMQAPIEEDDREDTDDVKRQQTQAPAAPALSEAFNQDRPDDREPIELVKRELVQAPAAPAISDAIARSPEDSIFDDAVLVEPPSPAAAAEIASISNSGPAATEAADPAASTDSKVVGGSCCEVLMYST